MFSGLNCFFPLVYFELSSYLSGSMMCSDGKCLFFRVRGIAAVMSNATKNGLFVSYFHITVYHLSKSGQELERSRNLETGTDV